MSVSTIIHIVSLYKGYAVVGLKNVVRFVNIIFDGYFDVCHKLVCS